MNFGLESKILFWMLLLIFLIIIFFLYIEKGSMVEWLRSWIRDLDI